MNINPAALRHRLLHSKIMEWTNDDALELIEQYRSKTELWNRSDPKYKDKLCRFRAWSEIADRFGCSKAEVERKMNVLLTQYRREKHKMLMKLYQGLQPSPSKWYAFKRFDFMEITVNTMASGNSTVPGSHPSPGGGGGGGSLGGGGGGGSSNSNILNTSSGGGGNSSITTNGHHHSHHHHSHHHPHSHHAAAAVAAAAALNGLTAAGYESASAASTTPTSSHHRRMKSKEMKYFGSVGSCMGLNIPILLANSQPLEPWNSVNQFSPPPINDRNHQLRVNLPLPFPTPGDLSGSGTNNLVGAGVAGGGGGVGGGARSLFGGSSNSDFAGSPHKPMDTTDIDERNDKCRENNGDGATTPSILHETSITSNEGRLSAGANETPGGHSENGSGGGGGGSGGRGGGSVGTNGDTESGIAAGNGSRRSDGNSGTDAGSSPIPNTNNFEAHKQRQLLTGGAISSGSREHDDLDIKQELLENYFHAPHPPAPPDSHRSYSPSDDNRNGGDCSDEFAQDLRVSAAAAAAAKGIDFTRFVLPPGLRRSTTDSIDDKFTPLNMRKLNPAVSNSGQAMLVGSLLSNESMSEDNNSVTSDRRRSGSLVGNQNGLNGVQDGGGTPSASAVATAAALYAESLNRDDCDHIGSNVSHKLRTMDRTQRIIAEKLIGEVLFYGQFNELERSARIQPK